MTIEHTVKHDLLKVAQLEANAQDEGHAYHYYEVIDDHLNMVSENEWIHGMGKNMLRVYMQRSSFDPDLYYYTILADNYCCATEQEKGHYHA